jgi:hypothetical protein
VEPGVGGMKQHVVRRGEYLAQLAFRYGFDAEAAWNHPKNAALKQARGDGNVLCPGDVLHVPENDDPGCALTVGASNTFVATPPTVEVKLLLRQQGKPLAGEPCVVHEIEAPNERTTDASGVLTVRVPVTLSAVTVEIPRLSVVRTFQVGHLDPMDAPSGVRQRLYNLGHGWRTQEELEDPARLSAAIMSFQRARGVPPTGELDQATADALAKEHGV